MAEPTLRAPAQTRGHRPLPRQLILGLGAAAALGLLALAAPVIAPHSPYAQDCAYGALRGSSPSYLLGTDLVCRDVLSRLLYAARTSLTVGVLSQALALALGIAVGAAAALAGRVIDGALMRLADAVYAFPDLLLIMVVAAALRGAEVPGAGIGVVVLAIAASSWMTVARLVRAHMLGARHQEFVLYARAVGAGPLHVLWFHLLPGALPAVTAVVELGIPRAIMAEASLGFLGLGVPPPHPTWGGMIQESYQAIFVRPLLALYPTLAIAVAALTFTALGEGLRQALEPRPPA